MPTPAMTAEQKQEAVDALEKYGSQQAAADALGLSRTTYQHRLHQGIRAAQQGEFGRSPVTSGFRISQMTSVLNEAGETVREFVQQKPLAGEQFEVPETTGSKVSLRI